MLRDESEADIGSVLIVIGVEGDTGLIGTASLNKLLQWRLQ